MDLQDRVAIVTGASRGIGRAVALALAGAGVRVACAARATDARPLRLPGTIDATVREVESRGGCAVAVPTNLAVPEEVEAMVHRTIEHFGRLDILVNNAAVTFPGDLDMPSSRFDLIMAINVRAPFLATRVAARWMKEHGGGAVLNVSSSASQLPVPGLMVYGMSKAALERFTVDAARQLQPWGIAVNGFRIDVPVASEGFLTNAPGADTSEWEPTDVPAEGILWMLRQPPEYTGRNESMSELRAREGIMKSRAARPFDPSRFRFPDLGRGGGG